MTRRAKTWAELPVKRRNRVLLRMAVIASNLQANAETAREMEATCSASVMEEEADDVDFAIAELRKAARGGKR